MLMILSDFAKGELAKKGFSEAEIKHKSQNARLRGWGYNGGHFLLSDRHSLLAYCEAYVRDSGIAESDDPHRSNDPSMWIAEIFLRATESIEAGKLPKRGQGKEVEIGPTGHTKVRRVDYFVSGEDFVDWLRKKRYPIPVAWERVLGAEQNPTATPDEVFEFKPGIWGLSVNLKALWKSIMSHVRSCKRRRSE